MKLTLEGLRLKNGANEISHDVPSKEMARAAKMVDAALATRTGNHLSTFSRSAETALFVCSSAKRARRASASLVSELAAG